MSNFDVKELGLLNPMEPGIEYEESRRRNYILQSWTRIANLIDVSAVRKDRYEYKKRLGCIRKLLCEKKFNAYENCLFLGSTTLYRDIFAAAFYGAEFGRHFKSLNIQDFLTINFQNKTYSADDFVPFKEVWDLYSINENVLMVDILNLEEKNKGLTNMLLSVVESRKIKGNYTWIYYLGDSKSFGDSKNRSNDYQKVYEWFSNEENDYQVIDLNGKIPFNRTEKKNDSEG